MSEKIYLNFFILCGILSQGIIGTLLEDNHNESSNLHIRKKRVIDNSIAGNSEYSIKDVPFIVQIIQNVEKICAGIIVSNRLVLTAKPCASNPEAEYKVESGERSMNTAKIHFVRDKFFEGHLVLLLVRPVIGLASPSRNRIIRLFEGSLPAQTFATISGWEPTSRSFSQPRSVYVPVISPQSCKNHYKQYNYEIEDDIVCTLDSSGQKGCTHEDSGSALVVGFGVTRRLAGVLILAGMFADQCGPDVFIRVSGNNSYYRWIESQINLHTERRINKQYSPNQYPHNQHPLNQDPHPHTLH